MNEDNILISLKDIVQPKEYRETLEIYKQIKDKYGDKTLTEFKKLAIIVGFTNGAKGYIHFYQFLEAAKYLLDEDTNPMCVFHFNSRKITDTFFGINIKTIKTNTLKDIITLMRQKHQEYQMIHKPKRGIIYDIL